MQCDHNQGLYVLSGDTGIAHTPNTVAVFNTLNLPTRKLLGKIEVLIDARLTLYDPALEPQISVHDPDVASLLECYRINNGSPDLLRYFGPDEYIAHLEQNVINKVD